MDTENKPIIRNANIPLLITGGIAFAITCIFTVKTYPLMYDINETTARIMMILPPVFCAIISLIIYRFGSSAVMRELSAFIFSAGIAASIILFKGFCGDNEMFDYNLGALMYFLPLAALAALIIFDCFVPFFIYGSLVLEICISTFTSEYTPLSYIVSLIAMIPLYVYTFIKSDNNDYRKYLTRLLIPAAIILVFFAAIGIWVIVAVFVAVIIAAIVVFKKHKPEKADFTVDIKRTLAAAGGCAIILPILLGIQLDYTFHLNNIRRQSFSAVFEIEKIEITGDKVSLYLKSEEPNKHNAYAGEKYALLKPIDGEENKYSFEGYSETGYGRKSVFIIAEYFNGKQINYFARYSDEKKAVRKLTGVYDSDDWDSAYVQLDVDYRGSPSYSFDGIALNGNETLENLFYTDYSVY